MSNDDSTVQNRPTMWPLVKPHDSPPPSVNVEVDVAAQQWCGPLHSVNDDHYVVVRMTRRHDTLVTSLREGELPDFSETGYGMVVADGMGAAGELASRLTISTLVQLSIDFGRWNLRVNEEIAGETMDRAERFLRTVDSTLLQAGRDEPGALQTMLTGAYSAGNDLFFVHVGRSRAYLFRDGELMQLTRDHTLDGEAAESAVVVDIATKAPASSPIVTETLGRRGPGTPRVDIERLGLLDGDLVLLCTDGLTDAVEDSRLADVLRQDSTLDNLCRALVAIAVGSGAKDDVTVLMARYRISGEPAPARDIAREP